MMLVILDYGMGNIRSLSQKLKKYKIESVVCDNPSQLEKATKIIIPGVGHFSKGYQNLKDRNLIETLHRKVIVEKTPVLGICLGMQLMTNFSEEGNSRGLGWIKGNTKKFIFKGDLASYRVPHIGWNHSKQQKESILFKNVESNYRFYFTHSYHVEPESIDDIVSITEYGFDFVSAIERDNIYGTQFHPEKSHYDGLKVISNFVKFA